MWTDKTAVVLMFNIYRSSRINDLEAKKAFFCAMKTPKHLPSCELFHQVFGSKMYMALDNNANKTIRYRSLQLSAV